MPQLVMTSGLDRALLVLVMASAAVVGSTRPLEVASQRAPVAAVPALIIADGYPSQARDPDSPLVYGA